MEWKIEIKSTLESRWLQTQNTKSFFIICDHGSFQSTSITDECQNVSIFFISEQKDAMCSLDRNGCSQL